MELKPGEKLGPYEIVSPLGRGGMGEVWRARDSRLGRDVAIKISDAQFTDRFEKEARAIAALNHPNICTLFDVGPNYLVMELIEGPTLGERIQEGAIPLEEALDIARQIADALEAAHEKGIVHRDLKPGNVKIRPDGSVKVLDFGLAKDVFSEIAISGDSPTLMHLPTQMGVILGTAAYMAPEQARGKVVDKRADIWSFGVVLHEMLTGKRLFEGEDLTETLASVVKSEPDISAAPPQVKWLLSKCLQKDPKKRLRDIGDVWELLESGGAARPVQTASLPHKGWIMAALLIGLAVAATAMLLLRPAPPVALASHFNVPSKPGALLQVSPDGKRLLLWRPDGFWLRPLDSPNWQKVPGTEAAAQNSVFWSPDSAAFGFMSAGRLRLASLDGSPPRDLMEVKNFSGASWRGTRDDGTILLGGNGKLQALDLRTGKIGALPLAFKAGSPPSNPVFLPEGDGFVFLQELGDGRRLYRSALDSSAAEPLFITTHGVQFAKHPATGKWHVFYLAGEPELRSSRILRTAPIDPKTGNLLAAPLKLLQGVSTAPSTPPFARFSVGGRGVLSWRYSAGNLPIWHLSWTDLTGKLLTRVSETRGYVSLALSPDEAKIAAQVDDPDGHIWILDSKTGLGGRLSTSPEPETYPRWAPDGKSLYYVSRTASAFEIRRSVPGDALNPEVLWRSESLNESTPIISGVSPDGGSLLVTRLNDSLYRLDLRSTQPAKMEVVEDSHRPGYFSLSPDGRSLVRMALREGLILRGYPLTAEPVKRFARGAGIIDKPFFSADGRALYGNFEGSLVMFPLSPDRSIGEPVFLRPWLTTTRAGAEGGVASRDGKRLLLIETDQDEILNPQVLTDWPTLLPK